MSDRRLTTLIALTVVALIGVLGGGAVAGASAAAADLTPRVEQALVRAGLEDVDVDVSGRDVTVSDGTQSELDEAVRLATAVEGVRTAAIDDRPGAVDRIDTTRPYLKLRRDPGRLRILGAVPTAAAAATVKATAARAFGVPVRGDLTIDPALPPARWTDELPAAFADLVGIDAMVLTVDGDTVRLSGALSTDAERVEVLGLLRRALPSLAVEPDLRVEDGGR